MDDLLKVVGTFFKAEWQTDGPHSWLSHFDGQMHWEVTYTRPENYLWITAGFGHSTNHVLESHGNYQSGRIAELLGGSHALILKPVGVNDDSSGAWIARHTNGFIELEMWVGKFRPAISD